MRKLVIIAFALISADLATETASAQSAQIGTRVNYATLHNQCAAADGAFIDGPYGFSCLVAGAGGVTSIHCNTGGQCTASCTTCTQPPTGDVAQILMSAADEVDEHDAAPATAGDANGRKPQ
jgi:hypothetical protein